MSVKSRIGMAVGLGVITLLILTGCPPKPPCDEKITDPEFYVNLLQSNPVVQEINSELSLRQVIISPCFVNNQVGIVIQYELPLAYSEYQVIYRDELRLSYTKDGDIGVPEGMDNPSDFQKIAILAYFKERIQEIESNPRIKEVIVKTGSDPLNPVLPLSGQVEISRSGNNRVEYSYFYGLVRGYTLSNDMDWQEFPEIKQAHRAIEENLLVGELSDCSIGHGEMHSYTSAAFHDSLEMPWNLTVALICEDGWKDASVKINNDGSDADLKIVREYNNK